MPFTFPIKFPRQIPQNPTDPLTSNKARIYIEGHRMTFDLLAVRDPLTRSRSFSAASSKQHPAGQNNMLR